MLNFSSLVEIFKGLPSIASVLKVADVWIAALEVTCAEFAAPAWATDLLSKLEAYREKLRPLFGATEGGEANPCYDALTTEAKHAVDAAVEETKTAHPS